MKLKISIFLLVAGIFFTSCNNYRTYADMKRDQKKSIDRVIAEKGLEIIHTYPADGVFKENQFVLLDNGVYLNVIDSGNGNRAVLGKTRILMRCSVERIFFLRGDTAKYNLFENGYNPIEFIYGNAIFEVNAYASSYSGRPYDNTPIECYYLSTGLESALKYVGENAEVKLIVPFDATNDMGSDGGSTYQIFDSYGAPIYYERVRFQFD